MTKIDKCDRCKFYGHNPHLICALHPSGVTEDCADYQPDPQPIKKKNNGVQKATPITMEN